MWIHEANLTHIKYKRKTVEARLATGAMQRVFPGDIIRFECASWGAPISLDVKVLSLLKYGSFKELLEHEGLKNCLPDVADITTGISHVNSAIANAKKPIMMAESFREAVISGRKAYLAGRMQKNYFASPSSPTKGLI